MNESMLEISEEINEGLLRLSAKGRIDSNSADILLKKLEGAIDAGRNAIILDMARVDYLSSIGIRVILKTYKQLVGSGGNFNIERPSQIVKNVLGMAALNEMLVKN